MADLGAGPGSGGGVGSGIGTGTGTSVGPGTGGGPAGAYPPTPTQFFLPPLPAPSSLKGYHLIAFFDVDEKGNATLLGFNPSRDDGYNRKLRDVSVVAIPAGRESRWDASSRYGRYPVHLLTFGAPGM